MIGVIADISHKKNDNICILGYGKLGKELYLRLKHTHIKTYIISRSKELIFKDKVENFYPLSLQNMLEVFSVCDIVVNTIPFNIISEECLALENKPYILDIASFPYGVDSNLISEYKDKINYKLYLGIPSVFAPKMASDILLKTLYKEIN